MRRPRIHLPVLLALACALAAGVASLGNAASSSVVVSMDVPSAVTITNQCTNAASYRFGTVQPGTPQLTSTSTACGIEFESSNDSAMLRASQSDGVGPSAMSASPLSWSFTNVGTGEVNDIDFAPSTTTGWAVGSSGLLLRSTDGGDSWAPHACAPCGTSTLVSVSAASTSAVFVGGTSGRVWRYDGTTWALLPAIAPANEVVALDAPDAATVWIASTGGYIWKSTNANDATPANVSWTAFQPTTGDFNGIDAVDANVMFAVGNTSRVARTTNGGGDMAITTIAGGGSLRDVAATSATVAVTVNSGGTAFETSNGTAWNSHNTGVFELLHEVERIGNQVIAATEYGRVARSTDGGVSWLTAVHTDSPASTAVAMVDATTYVVGGRGKNLQRSTDSGANWNWEHTTVPAVWDVAAVDASESFAVGEQGTILRSTDSGTNWTAQTSNVSETLHGVAVTGTAGDRLIAVGDGGVVTTTTNGGTTWTARTSGTTERLRAVTMVDDHYAWAVGDNGTILRSVNGGQSWTAQTSGTAHSLLSITAVSKDVAWAAGGTWNGSNRSILGTTDGGATWTVQYTAAGYPVVAVSAISPTRAMAVSQSGRLITTTNGTTWPTETILNSGRVFTLAMAEENVAFMSVYDTVYRTTDFGATWTAVTGVGWAEFHHLDVVDPDTVWAVAGGRQTAMSGAGGSISDYGAAPNSWAPSSSGLFGVCLQSVGVGTTAVWTRDTMGVSGQCEAVDTDPWRAIPLTPSKVASAPQGTVGRANFVFGVRPAVNQAPGTYYAGVTFEALAPNV